MGKYYVYKVECVIDGRVYVGRPVVVMTFTRRRGSLLGYAPSAVKTIQMGSLRAILRGQKKAQ